MTRILRFYIFSNLTDVHETDLGQGETVFQKLIMVCTQIFGSEFQKHEFKTYSNVFPKRERNLFLNAALILPFKIHLSTEIRQKFQKIHKINQTSGTTMRYILASRFESTLCRVRKHIVYQELANKYEFTNPESDKSYI